MSSGPTFPNYASSRVPVCAKHRTANPDNHGAGFSKHRVHTTPQFPRVSQATLDGGNSSTTRDVAIHGERTMEAWEARLQQIGKA